MTLRATLSPYAVEADPAEFLAKALGKGRNIEPAELNLTLSNLGVPDESSSPPAELSKYELPVSAGLRPSPTVSLYIPAYNAAAFLPRTLPSVFAQSVKPAEVLLIDDGSTDETASIGKTFPLRVVKHPQNLGLAAARNTALREAKSDLIACLDSDVAPDRYWLERLLSPLDDPRVAGVTGRLVEQHTCAIADRLRRPGSAAGEAQGAGLEPGKFSYRL